MDRDGVFQFWLIKETTTLCEKTPHYVFTSMNDKGLAFLKNVYSSNVFLSMNDKFLTFFKKV